MSNKIIVSCLQYTSLKSEIETLKKIGPLIKDAALRKSDLIALPECATFLCEGKNSTLQNACLEKNSVSIYEISKMAVSYKVNILIGSLQIRLNENKKLLANRSYMINKSGKIVNKYDKIHMFDVKLKNGQEFNESKIYSSGKKAIVSKLEVKNRKYFIGLTICYDLRFPNLFQDLAKAGSEIICVPSAFTKTTGKVHWHTLLKARAIETGCFFLAPAQVGTHFPGRESYGHSLIVNPWGEVLADGEQKEGIITSKLDINEVNKTRMMIPNLKNQKKYSIKF